MAIQRLRARKASRQWQRYRYGGHPAHPPLVRVRSMWASQSLYVTPLPIDLENARDKTNQNQAARHGHQDASARSQA